MIVALLAGCAPHLFPMRAVSCGEGLTLAAEAMAVEVVSEDGECEVRVPTTADIEGDVILEASEVELAGVGPVWLEWGASLDLSSAGQRMLSEEAGSLDLSGDMPVLTAGNVRVQSGDGLSLVLERSTSAVICSNASGTALLDSAVVTLATTPDAGPWQIDGSGQAFVEVVYDDDLVDVTGDVQSQVRTSSSVAFACCETWGVECPTEAPP